MKIYQVDAFTDKIFFGNPAGVCLYIEDEKDEWMQNLATEMNLSETAFLKKQGDRYLLRWFTPKSEVDLCGHATLAAAHILWEEDYEAKRDEIVFNTKSGVLKAKNVSDLIELNFPLEEAREVEVFEELITAFGTKPIYVGKNRMDYIIEVKDANILRNINPNMNILKKIGNRGFIVTSISDSDKYDFMSRFFAPNYGIDEDPVTGSAHCCLAPYWKRKLLKSDLKAFQASKRGGELLISVENDRVFIRGNAKTVFKGELIQ